MENRKIYSGADYKTLFEPRSYLDTFYSSIDSHKDEGYLSFCCSNLGRFYAMLPDGLEALLDVGCGPNLHATIGGACKFSKIYLSDYAVKNLAEIEKWRYREHDSFNWSHIFKYYAPSQNVTSVELQEIYRSKIQACLPINVLDDSVSSLASKIKFDALVTTLCLEAACPTFETYCQAWKNLVALLKPEGYAIVVGVLDETFYKFNDKSFYCLKLNKEMVQSALKDAGFKILEWKEHENAKIDQSEDAVSDALGAFAALLQLI